MKTKIHERHTTDGEGNPAGGLTTGTGIRIYWQDGPLGRDGGRKDPNGAFVEDVIAAALGRLRFYQRSAFNCSENENAIAALDKALDWLNDRTLRREAAGTEGTHKL
jgi:hypothetical protein